MERGDECHREGFTTTEVFLSVGQQSILID